MLIKELCDVQKITINPQKQENVLFTHYSLPSFDNNKTPDIVYGKEILSSKYVVPKNVILYNKLNLRFKRIWNIKNNTKINCICSGEFIPLVIKNNIILQDYLYYYLLTDKLNKKLLETAHGTSSSHQRIDINDLLNYEIKVPSMEEQLHIVDTIGSIDDLIESIKCKIDKLNEILMNLFDKLPLVNGNKFYDIFTTMNGGTFSSKDYLEHSNEKLITIKNINSEGFDSSSPTYFKYNEKYEKYRLNIGDILLTMTGAYLGRSGIVDDENCFLNQRVLKVSSVSNAFTYCFLQKNKDNIFNLGKGSAQQNLGLKELACFDVNYSTETIKEFTNYDLFIDNIVKYKITIRKLNNIKQIYLKKFFG